MPWLSVDVIRVIVHHLTFQIFILVLVRALSLTFGSCSSDTDNTTYGSLKEGDDAMSSGDRAKIITAARSQITAEAAAVLDIADQIDERFIRVASLIHASAGKVVFTGSGTSGFMAQRAAHLFSVSGTPAFSLNPATALHGSMGAVEANDILIAFSKGGESTEINEFCEKVQATGTKVVAITAKAKSTLGQLADITVALRDFPDADPGNLLAMGSTLAHSVWIDAMSMVLMRGRRLSWERIHFMHPGGAVGLLSTLPEPLEPLDIPPYESSELQP